MFPDRKEFCISHKGAKNEKKPFVAPVSLWDISFPSKHLFHPIFITFAPQSHAPGVATLF